MGSGPSFWRPATFGPSHVVYLDLAGGSYVRPETGGLTLTGALTEDETRYPMDPELLGSEVGELMAELITEGRTTINRARFRLDRFAGLKPTAGTIVSSYLL